MVINEPFAKENIAHVHHVFGVLGRRRHAHEHLVGILHRRIGDAKMPLADRVVVRLDNVMSRAVQRRRHVAEFVKHRQIFQQRIAAHVFQIPQIRCACHRDKDGVLSPQLDVVF